MCRAVIGGETEIEISTTNSRPISLVLFEMSDNSLTENNIFSEKEAKYKMVKKAADHCWNPVYMNIFREFYASHATMFINAPLKINGEQNLEYYSLFLEYLQLYENTLQNYIESLDFSIDEFYAELKDIKNDSSIKDKKLMTFVNYLLACTDYKSFYRVMVRSARKELQKEGKIEEIKDRDDEMNISYDKDHSKNDDDYERNDFRLEEHWNSREDSKSSYK